MTRRSRIPFLSLGFLALGLLGTAGAGQPPRPQGLEEAQHTLSTLHLLRGLQLSIDQVKAVRAVAEEAEALREEYRKAELVPLATLEAGIRDYIDRLLAGTAGDGLEDPETMKVYTAKGKDRARENAWLARMGEVEKKLDGILSPSQVRVTEKFTRCLIAPLYMADPERVGQVSDNSAWLKVLDEVRGLDSRTWEGQRAERIEEFLFGVESEVGPLAPLRRERLAARCERVLEKARSLSNIMYRLRRNELANFLDLEEQERLHYKKLRGLQQSIVGGPGTLAHWLLSPQAARLYPRLQAALEAGVTIAPLPELTAMATCVPSADGTRMNCSTGKLSDVEVRP